MTAFSDKRLAEKKDKNGKTLIKVSWVGYPEKKFDSWIRKSQFVSPRRVRLSKKLTAAEPKKAHKKNTPPTPAATRIQPRRTAKDTRLPLSK